MSDLRSQLQDTLAPQYTIERELGGGGMARVFLATEHRLGRLVVIKVLRPELAAEVSTKRFEREIRLAASLQQANIVPVLATGETGGLPHYIMPFVEGRALRDRLESAEPLSLGDSVSILRDIARALAYAHHHGVVHRDIKPENVLLSGDAAVVTDFGIAKAIATAKESDESGERRNESTVTTAGTSVGTPAYMAPEQITADPAIDHRADLYAFGCVAYELLTGKPPFESDALHGLYAAHLADEPVPVFERNAAIPPALGALVMRCLEKSPALRPQSARELLPVLESTTSQATGLQRLVHTLSRRQRRAVAIGVAVGAVALTLALARGWPIDAARETSRVVVIPFLNPGGEPSDEYLADGMADELATGLGKVPGVTVLSRSLGYRYKGQQPIDAQEIGAALDADYVLHGSVRRAGDRLRVSAQLTSALDAAEVWADTYDGSATDAFAAQDSLTRLLVSALPRGIGAGAPTAVVASAGSSTTDAEAYDLYLRGRFLLQRRAVRGAAETFERAIVRDSNFARAHASLALALELRPYFENVNARELGIQAITAARRALALDSTLAEAHTALAMAHQHLYQWDEAEASYRRALAFNPNEADAHIQWGRFLFYTGRGDAALDAFQRAREIDPLSPVASGWVGHLHCLAGRHQRGLAEIERALALDSLNPPALVMHSEVMRELGRLPEARRSAERLWNAVPNWRGAAAMGLLRAGDSSRSIELVRALESVEQPSVVRDFDLALQYGGRGDTTRMFELLERATSNGEIWPTYWSMSERSFDPVRRSSRFAAIVRSVGLDDRIFTSPTGGRPR